MSRKSTVVVYDGYKDNVRYGGNFTCARRFEFCEAISRVDIFVQRRRCVYYSFSLFHGGLSNLSAKRSVRPSVHPHTDVIDYVNSRPDPTAYGHGQNLHARMTHLLHFFFFLISGTLQFRGHGRSTGSGHVEREDREPGFPRADQTSAAIADRHHARAGAFVVHHFSATPHGQGK